MFNSKQGIEIQRKIQTANQKRALDAWWYQQIKDLPPFDCWHGNPPAMKETHEPIWPGAPKVVGPNLKWDGDQITSEQIQIQISSE